MGDFAFDEYATVAGAITTVPGSIGPMTIAMLIANTVGVGCQPLRRTPQHEI